MAGISSAPERMAGSTVTYQMDVLLSKASGLGQKDPAILGHAANSQLEELVKTAKDVRIMLSDAEDKEINAENKELEMWLEEVNAAIFMVDDVLNKCRYHVHIHDKSIGCKEPKDKVWAYFSNLGRKSLSNGLKSMNSKLQISTLNFGVVSSIGVPKGAPDGRSASAQAAKDCWKLESEVIEDGVQTVVDKLLNPDNVTCLSVIAIVGWAETGKMVLAQVAYKNMDVMCYFDERMWVQVPMDLDTDTIAERMLTNLSHAGTVASKEEAVSLQLKKRLRGKRFLLVLVGASDINPASFIRLKEFLEGLGGFRGSKVLITTGKYPKFESFYVHNMRLNTSQYCWTLFERIAFAEGGGPIDRGIVDACAGDPLYIKLVGSLMYRFKDESQWSSIVEKLNDCLAPERIPQLCFDYMSSIPLKRCFQYCYFFPKGCLMRREELIELWMAQGYLDLQSGHADDMETLGREYYGILMRSCFLQLSEENDFEMQSCKIPAALYGLNFFMERNSSNRFKTIEKGDAKDFTNAVHLALIDCHVKYTKSFKHGLSKLQSLHLENTQGLTHILGCAHGLRVMIVVDESLLELPDSIGKLIRLRYLDISRTSIVKLPDSISELYNLQTLKLHDLQNLPANFDKLLLTMIHLYIHKLEDLYGMCELLSGCGELVHLSSAKAALKVFVKKQDKLGSKDLHKLSNKCSTISIHCLENASKDATGVSAWLAKITGMESLKLSWSARRENSIDEDVLVNLKPHQSLKRLAVENFKGTSFPAWMTGVDSLHISNLEKLELENCSWCEHLPPLGHLPCLRILKIAGMDNVKKISPDFYGGSISKVFPRLKDLTLCGMSKLEDWSGATGSSTSAFPYLERFDVDQCPKLKGIPDIVLAGEQNCLRKFKVSRCENLTYLPRGLGEVEYVEDLELFGLPALQTFCLGCANTLKTLIIGCFSAKLEEDDLLKQLESLSSLTNLTIWGYWEENIPDCFGKLSSLEVLKFESCRQLNTLPQIMSLKELHICYCPLLEDSCIRGSRPEWAKVSHIQTIVVNTEIIREPPT